MSADPAGQATTGNPRKPATPGPRGRPGSPSLRAGPADLGAAGPAGPPPEGGRKPGTLATPAGLDLRHSGHDPAPGDDLADIIEAGRVAEEQLLAELAAAGDPDLTDVIAAGEAAQAQLLADLRDPAVEADLRSFIEELARRYPLTLTDDEAAEPVDDQADAQDQASAPEAGPGPAAVAAALATLRAYLHARPDDPDTPAALDALAAVAHVGAAGDRLLPLTAVAAQLGVSDDTVRRLIAAGDLDAARIGYRTVRVPADSLARYRARLAGAEPSEKLQKN